MRKLILEFSACLLSLLIYFSAMPLAEAKLVPRWTIAIKGGLFAPSVSGWVRQNESSQENIAGLSLGFKLTPRLVLGLEGSYFSADGKALTSSGRLSGTDQRFTLFPAQTYLVYHLAFSKDQAWVPYLGGGYSRFIYRTEVEGAEVVKGAQAGYHFRAGLAFLLDVLDPRAAARSEHWGLVNSYFFVEGQYAKVDDFGAAAIDLGGWTYSTGLRYEF